MCLFSCNTVLLGYHKARLKKSGLRDRIYLVESYNAKANKDQFGQQIQTSKSELMLLDDCHLHETPDWKASVDYLVMRTDVLNQVHKVHILISFGVFCWYEFFFDVAETMLTNRMNSTTRHLIFR